MGILKSAADLVYTIRFLKLLVTPIENTEAFKLGIVDENGKRRKDFDDNTMENREALRDHYTAFHRLVYNLKKIMAKAPGGKSVVARYGAALALIKEHGELSDTDIEKIHAKTGIDILDVLAEDSQWFMLHGNEISPGVYRMKNDSMTATSFVEAVSRGDEIRIEDGNPVEEMLGLSIYEGTHLKTRQRIYFTTGEITK